MIKHLEFLVIKGKRLLTLMQICRKYELQNEKIIPFINHTESSQVLSQYQIIALSEWNVFRQVYTQICNRVLEFLKESLFHKEFTTDYRFSRYDKFLAAI